MSVPAIRDNYGFLDMTTGELLPATVDNAARVLNSARAIKEQVNQLVQETTAWLAEEAARRGTKTLYEGGSQIVLTGGAGEDYDAVDLMDALRAADCPEDRIEQAVVAVITYKVNRSVLRQLAAANPDYKAAIDLARREVEKPWRASIKTRKGDA
jgi:hypothetical protein